MIKFIKKLFGHSDNGQNKFESERDKEIRKTEEDLDSKMIEYKMLFSNKEYESADKIVDDMHEIIYRLEYLRGDMSYWRYKFEVDKIDSRYQKQYGKHRE